MVPASIRLAAATVLDGLRGSFYMNIQEALNVFGLSGDVTEADIKSIQAPIH